MVAALLVIFFSEKEVLQQHCDRAACQKAWHVMAGGDRVTGNSGDSLDVSVIRPNRMCWLDNGQI